MLIEIKVKTTSKEGHRTKKKLETYLIEEEFFANAEYEITKELQGMESFEIQSMKISSIKEIDTQSAGQFSFIATLRDTWTADDGTEKHLKYNILLWANDLTEANHRVKQLAKQGYDMLIEGIKQADYEYLKPAVQPTDVTANG